MDGSAVIAITVHGILSQATLVIRVVSQDVMWITSSVGSTTRMTLAVLGRSYRGPFRMGFVVVRSVRSSLFWLS
jgi:hypothetical protein